jgi:hypothetical protein
MEFSARRVGSTKISDDDRVVLNGADLRAADFSGRKLQQFSAAGSRLVECRFDKARIESASFGGGREISEYVDCVFDGSHIAFGPGGYARFVRCSFRDAELHDWFCFAVELVDCTFSGRLRKAVFNGTVPEDKRAVVKRERNEIRDNDFTDADLIDVAFRTGIDLTAQQLPSGPQYVFLADAPTALQHARAEITHWDDLELRRKALQLLGTLEDETGGGQRQLLLRKDDFPRSLRDAVDAVFALL